MIINLLSLIQHLRSTAQYYNHRKRKMATLTNTIKKAEKLSGSKIQIDSFKQHSVTYKGYKISFFANGRIEEGVEATNFYAQKGERSANDIQQEYFSGSFFDNIAQCFKHVDYMTRDEETPSSPELELVLSVLAYVDQNHIKEALKFLNKSTNNKPKSEQQAFAKKCFESYILI